MGNSISHNKDSKQSDHSNNKKKKSSSAKGTTDRSEQKRDDDARSDRNAVLGANGDAVASVPSDGSSSIRRTGGAAQYSTRSASPDADQPPKSSHLNPISRQMNNDIIISSSSRPIDISPSVIEERSDPGLTVASPILFINLVDFKRWGRIPKQPECMDITVDSEQLLSMRDHSLFVYVSHNWLVGDDGMVYVDDDDNSKYQLIVSGVEDVHGLLAPGLRHCYLWIDCGCRTTGADYKQLPEIIMLCDCMFTPICDPYWSEWHYPPSGISNIYEDYRAALWNVGEDAYVNRAWCRLEMCLAAHVPPLPNAPQRIACLAQGLRTHLLLGKRPHLLFGHKELCLNQLPQTVPPLARNLLAQYHPTHGRCSHVGDAKAIGKLLRDLLPIYLKEDLFVGQQVLQQQQLVSLKGPTEGLPKTVLSVQTYSSGDTYEGVMLRGKRHGRGLYTWTTGNSYEGQWQAGRRLGRGVFKWFSGDVYEGEWRDDKQNGVGVLRFIDGSSYNGEWRDDIMHGVGRFTYADGSYYDGEWRNGRQHGKGLFKKANGNVYDGEWRDDCKHGVGRYIYVDGSYYDGEWRDGRGIFQYANGHVYEGR